MSAWKTVRLGEICSRVFSGGTPSKSNSAFYEHGNIPWLNTGEVNFRDIYSTENCITQAGYDKSAAKWVEPNSIIIAMYGATAGKSCITRIRLTTNQACCNLQINDKVADYRFVYYTVYGNYLGLASLAKGGAQQNLNAQIIKDYEIPLPPLPTQRRIAAILSDYDAAIANCRKQIALLEEAAQRLYREIISAMKGNSTTIDSVLTHYANGGWGKDSSIGKFTNRGFVIRGTDIAEICGGQLSGVPMRYHSENDLNTKSLQASDLILELSNGNIDNIGRCLRVTESLLNSFDAPVLCASFCKFLRPKSSDLSILLYWSIKAMQNDGRLKKFKNAGANGINNFDFENFVTSSLEIDVPDGKEFASLIAQTNMIDTLRNQIRSLTEARDRLLPKLMSGEVAA